MGVRSFRDAVLNRPFEARTGHGQLLDTLDTLELGQVDEASGSFRIQDRERGADARGGEGVSYVDVYGPRPIATGWLDQNDGHNC